MKLHALQPSPPPPPPAPVRPSAQPPAVAVALPFRNQPVDAVQPPAARRSPAPARGNAAATQGKQSIASTVLLDQGARNGSSAGDVPYRRGAFVDITA